MRALNCCRVRRVIAVALWIVAACSLALVAQATAASPGMSVTRSLSAAHALPESTFQVTLELKADVDLNGVGLREKLPFGWTIHPVENAGAAFKRSEGEWVFSETLEAGKTVYVTYEVSVPAAGQLMSDPLPQCFTISGTYQSTIPSLELPTDGESSIEIVSSLPIGTAIAHLIPQQVSGVDSIDLRLSRWISEAQLQRALELWQDDLPVPETGGQRIDLATMNHLAAQFETCTRADDALPLSIDPELNAVRTLETFLPCDRVLLPEGCLDPGQSARLITVSIKITPSFDAYGVGLKEWFPEAWKATPIAQDGFWYRPSASEWVYPTRVRAGETLEMVYQIEVIPSSYDLLEAGAGCCGQEMTIVGEASSALECSVAPVLGEDTVTVDTCLPVILAISRWDVANDRLDVRLSDVITFPQVQRAVQFWIQNLPVPHTCGYTVGYHTLKTIVAYWLSGTPVSVPLSQDSSLPACGGSIETCESASCIDGWICQLGEMQDPADFVGLPDPEVYVDAGPDRVLTCAQPFVTLSGVTTGGLAPFKYEWKDGNGQTVGTSQTLEVTSPGTYTLIAISCGGCLATDTVAVIEDVAPPIIEASVSNVLTGYVPTGEVAASISGGTGPYSVLWTTPSGGQVADALALNVADPGLYEITVIGANGCSSTSSVQVIQDIEPPSIQIEITPALVVDASPVDPVLTCSLTEIVLEGRVSGGREPYILLWTNSQGSVLGDTATLAVDAPETYLLTATGANGISASTSVDVGRDIEAPSVTVTARGQLTCAVTEIEFTTMVVGGRSPFTYQWMAASGDIIGSESCLTATEPGAYTVLVMGSNGCTASAEIVVVQDIAPPMVTTSVNDILACDVVSVRATAAASGGRAPYTYTWSDASGQVVGELASLDTSNPGTYTVTVVGANGCSTEASALVEQDIEPPLATASANGVITCAVPTVTLHANVEGGRTPYSYQWTDEAEVVLGTSLDLSTSTPGTYTLRVTGANGCQSIDRIVVDEDVESPVLSITVDEPLTCAVTEVQLMSVISGGRAPYTYNWMDAGGRVLGQASTLTVSSPGIYTLAVIGANGCQSTANATVQQDLEPPVIVMDAPEQLTCAVTEVTVAAAVTGGRTPYSYAWTDASDQIIGQSEEVVVSTPGVYSVLVVGANGCQSTATVTVQQDLEPPVVFIPEADELTCAVTEATLIAATAGGRPPYVYAWIDEAGQILGCEPLLVVDKPGVYSVIVAGDNGCEASASITVQQDIAAPIVTIPTPDELTCFVTQVAVTAVVTGGRAPYAYAWTDADNQLIGQSEDITVPMPGVYFVTVTGDNGCQASAIVTVQQNIAPPVIVIPAPDELTCAVTDVTLTANVTGGRPPYVYAWANDAGQILGRARQLVVDEPGDYSITVTGGNGCQAAAIVTVQQDIEPPAITIPAPEDLSCSVTHVTLTPCVSAGRAPYVYAWVNLAGQIVGLNSQLVVAEPGVYTLTVTGANGCASSACVTVQQDIAPPCITLCESQMLTCADPRVFVDATICGGREPFTYQWTDDCGAVIATTEDVTLGFAGIYMLTVTGANGCSSSSSVEIIDGINPPTVDAGPDQVLVCVGDEVVLDATVTGGTCPYTYIWVDSCGEIVGNCEDLIVTVPGIYILTVQSADGCVGVDSVIVELP